MLTKGMYPLLSASTVKGRLIAGSFRPNGATGVVSGSERGHGWSVARTGAGLYTITLDEPVYRLVAFGADASFNGADGTNPVVVNFESLPGTDNKTFKIVVGQEAAGTFAAADLAADAENIISFFILAEETDAYIR